MLSLVAASLGVVICTAKQHFVLRLSRPTGFTTMFQHRCGLVTVAAVCWMVFEVTLAVNRRIRWVSLQEQ